MVMYGCENWTIKKVEHRRIDAFELWELLPKVASGRGRDPGGLGGKDG